MKKVVLAVAYKPEVMAKKLKVCGRRGAFFFFSVFLFFFLCCSNLVRNGSLPWA